MSNFSELLCYTRYGLTCSLTLNLSQVEYNCVPKTDPYLMERMTIISEFMKNTTVSTIVGTEHQIHFINQVTEPTV